MSYNPASEIISAPVSIGDVKSVVPVVLSRTVNGVKETRSSSDLGVLCGASVGDTIPANDGNGSWTVEQRIEVNKWAKYKPVCSSSISTYDQWDTSNNSWKSSAYWWKSSTTRGTAPTGGALAGSCGMEIPYFTYFGELSNTTSFVYKLYHGQLPWTYLKPRGGHNEIYRLTDFAMYFHGADPVMGELGLNTDNIIWVTNGGQGTTMTLGWDAPSGGDDRNLSLSDFTINGISLSQFYIGVLMVRSNGNNWSVVTSTQRIGNGDTTINTTIGYSDIGEWNLIPFLSSVQITRGGTLTTGTYLSCDKYQAIKVYVKPSSEYIDIFVFAEWREDSRKISYEVIVKNNLSSSKTISGINVYVYSTTNSTDDPSTGNLEQTINVSGCTVAPGDTYHYAISEAALSFTRNTSKTYWITGRPTDGTTYTNDWLQIEEDSSTPPSEQD